MEAGNHRLVGYLRHQMDKEPDPAAKFRRWVEGIMAQAADPDVAHSTRAVVWNGGHVGDRSRPEAAARYATLTELILGPISGLGSSDPDRDGAFDHLRRHGLDARIPVAVRDAEFRGYRPPRLVLHGYPSTPLRTPT